MLAFLVETHKLAFAKGRAWSKEAFADLLDDKAVHLFYDDHGFLLARAITHEVEILTLAVKPEYQSRGIGKKLMARMIAHYGEVDYFLEVACDNHAAIKLYHHFGFVRVGKRVGYYRLADNTKLDALVFQKSAS